MTFPSRRFVALACALVLTSALVGVASRSGQRELEVRAEAIDHPSSTTVASVPAGSETQVWAQALPTTTTAPPPPPTTTTAPAPSPPPTTLPAPSPAPSGSHADPADPATWDRLAQCESGQNWASNTGNGYYGGLQFSLGTWRSVGGAGRPDQNSRDEQIHRGQLLQARSGWGQWPACTRRLGYR